MGNLLSCLDDQGNVIHSKKKKAAPPPNTAASVSTIPPRNDECCNKDSIFYDAKQSMTMSMMDDNVYVPASLPSFIPRGSVIMEEPETLLRDSGFSKKRRQTILVQHDLQEPQLKVDQRGYPGNLTTEELEAALEFRRALKEDVPKRENVEVFLPIGIEDEPHALCRFLRARTFNVEETLAFVGENTTAFEHFKRHDFYPTIEEAVGCPGSVLLSQYPYLFYGNAKNGCPINYQMIGRMKLEGVECITEPDRLADYVVHSIMYQFSKQVKKAQEADSTRLVRCECIAVIDLKGLDTSQLSKKALAVLKTIGSATSCFPEMLNRMIVLNASRAFYFFWTLIKAFAEERTVAKIEIYTNEKTGKQRMLELAEEKELLSDYGGSAPAFDELALKFLGSKGATRQTSELLLMNGHPHTVVELSENEKASISVYTRSEGEVTLLRDKGAVVKTVNVQRPEVGDSPMPFCTEITSGESGPGKLDVSASPGPTSAATDYLVVYVEVFALTSS